MALFKNRKEAGQLLAGLLKDYTGRSDVIVLGLPRGGVPVAFEVARQLEARLDVFLVRKLGVPGRRDLAMGAIASGGVRMLNKGVVRALDIPPEVIDAMAAKEQQVLVKQALAYRGDHPQLPVQDRLVILVDDGLANGASMRAAIAALRNQKPARIIAALPTASARVCQEFADWVEALVCVERPQSSQSVGTWYEDFSQPTEEEIRTLLRQANQPAQAV